MRSPVGPVASRVSHSLAARAGVRSSVLRASSRLTEYSPVAGPAASAVLSGDLVAAYDGDRLVGGLHDVERVDGDLGVGQPGADAGAVGAAHVDGHDPHRLPPAAGLAGQPADHVAAGPAGGLAEQAGGPADVHEPGLPLVGKQLPGAGVRVPAQPAASPAGVIDAQHRHRRQAAGRLAVTIAVRGGRRRGPLVPDTAGAGIVRAAGPAAGRVGVLGGVRPSSSSWSAPAASGRSHRLRCLSGCGGPRDRVGVRGERVMGAVPGAAVGVGDLADRPQLVPDRFGHAGPHPGGHPRTPLQDPANCEDPVWRHRG